MTLLLMILSHLLLVVGCGQGLWHQAICGRGDLVCLMELRQGSGLMDRWSGGARCPACNSNRSQGGFLVHSDGLAVMYGP